MKKILHHFFRFCPKTGKFKGVRQVKGFSKLLLPVIGLLALIWILIRVIPKPSRLNYPCVKTAMPLAAGFIGNIIFMLLSALAYIKLKKSKFRYQFLFAAVFAAVSISGTYYLENQSDKPPVYPTVKVEANQPIGVAKGIFPGRVVWVYDPNATNENCNPTEVGHAWWMPENNDQAVIDGMVSKAIQSLTGKTTDKDAWEAIFKYHNNTRGKGSANYKPGEKIFIKINNVSGWGGNFSTKDLSVKENGSYGISETSPEIILSVLRQLVNVVGVAQSDIYVGDPLRNTYKHCYDMWHNEFQNVHYVSHDNYSNLGREQLVADTKPVIFYSDKGSVLRENVWDTNRLGGDTVKSDCLYKVFEEAEYILNIPMLKGHKRAGVTMFAKNHFGSHTRADASHLHGGLVDPIEIEYSNSRREYGLYRVQVDMMGSKMLGGKTLFFLMDALWPADQEISYPKKFQMPPFNNDWMSSIFASLDPVAIESVGYDFLRSEFTAARNVGDGAGTYPQKPAADDYLQQAADTTLWAAGIKYDPDGNGVHLKSLGTHEHWNNKIDKEYSRNLKTGNGIELIKAGAAADPVTPVELSSFTAKLKNKAVQLIWETKTETNNHGFEIERFINNTWHSIGFIRGKGTTSESSAYLFIDKNIYGDKAVYRLKQLDYNGAFKYSQTVEVELYSTNFEISQNYPNPFNPSTTIDYSVPVDVHVSFRIYNSVGEEVANLVNQEMKAGRHSVTWNASNVPSGVYYYKISAGSYSKSNKMMLLK